MKHIVNFNLDDKGKITFTSENVETKAKISATIENIEEAISLKEDVLAFIDKLLKK